jgi:hypothetical protein
MNSFKTRNLGGAPGQHPGARTEGMKGMVVTLAVLFTIGAGFWLGPMLHEPVPAAGRYQTAVDRRDSVEWQVIWVSRDQAFSLKAGTNTEDGWVCPQILGHAEQPFCRRFSAAVVGACQRGESLQIVLADGDIHQVDHALIGTAGSFTPAHHREHALSLRDAWFPEGTCGAGAVMAQVVALDDSGKLMHFDGAHWRKVSSGLLAAENVRP